MAFVDGPRRRVIPAVVLSDRDSVSRKAIARRFDIKDIRRFDLFADNSFPHDQFDDISETTSRIVLNRNRALLIND